MRVADIPDTAFSAPATPVPTKTVTVYDWDALHQTLITEGFVVLESDDVRINTNGTEDSAVVKCFNSHLRITKKLKLKTRRITKTRWYCTL
jgi:hypothetical protein